MRGRVWLFLIGQASSVLAGSMMLLALGVWAKQLTGSNTLAGLCTAAVMAPGCLAFLWGSPWVGFHARLLCWWQTLRQQRRWAR